MPTEKKLTGYPSIDKPWLKYYSEEAINASLPECTIYEYLWENNKDHLDDIALIYFGKKITYGELFENIDKAARALFALGIQAGEIVTIFSSNTPETIYCIYALNLIGAIANMEYITLSEKEALKTVQDCNCKTVIILDVLLSKFSSFTNSNVIKNIVSLPLSASMPVYKKMLVYQKIKVPYKSKVKKYCDCVNCGNTVKLKKQEYVKDTPAVMVHSGGTTGVPKGVVLSNDNLNSIAWQYLNIDADYCRQDIFLHSIPSFHAFGIATGVHMPLCLGFTIDMVVKFTEKEISNHFLKNKPSHIFLSSSHIHTVLNSAEKLKINWLKSFAFGGAGITPDEEVIINKFLKSHKSQTKGLIGYGLSELSSTVCFETNEWYGKPGSVGIPFCKANIKVIDVETGKELSFEQEGELCISTPGLMLEYYKNEYETKNAVFADGNGVKWLHTGDMGYVDNDGFVFITGRMKRVYITRVNKDETGFKLFPDFVANKIKEHNDVKDCAVICIPDQEYKNIAIAFVVSGKNVNTKKLEDDIYNYLRQNIAIQNIPKKIYFVEKIPLTAVGKVDYRALEKEAEKL